MAFGSLPSVLGSGGGTAYSLIGGTGLFADGTAAAPSISFAADTYTGFYRQAANVIGLSAGGTLQLRFSVNNYILGAVVDNNLRLTDAGGVQLNCAGTNQNITLTPSGTGQVSHIGLSNFSDTLFFGNSSGSYGRITWGSALTFQAGAGLPFTLVSSNGTEVARGFANGRFGIGTGATDSGALLQVGTNTTNAAGGIGFGTDTGFYRVSSGSIALDYIGGNTPLLALRRNGADGGYFALNSLVLQFQNPQASGTIDIATVSGSGGSITLRTANAAGGITLDATSNTSFTGTIKPQLATTAGAPAYVKGAIYFDTTLNKLRVGGATAWETITSV
jgi:hypothetical protein